MATWMAHLRIADGILDKMQGLEATEFVIGNIALDSGVPTPDVLSWLLRPLADRYFVGTGDCFFIKRKRRRGISKNPQETIWKWKGDWYDLDFLYLKQHPDFRTFQIYENAVGFENTYLDFLQKIHLITAGSILHHFTMGSAIIWNGSIFGLPKSE